MNSKQQILKACVWAVQKARSIEMEHSRIDPNNIKDWHLWLYPTLDPNIAEVALKWSKIKNPTALDACNAIAYLMHRECFAVTMTLQFHEHGLAEFLERDFADNYKILAAES